MAEEQKPTVAFLGSPRRLPPSTNQVSLTPEITIEDVFSAVQSGTAYRGVVPFENSSNGSVVFTLDLFADLNNKYPDILVCGEAYVHVKHCLLGYSSNPTTPDYSNIKKLYSHPQAWGQCKNFLTRYLKTAERHDVSSTSKAAEIASKDKSGESAALSSFIAAELFGLNVLAKEINDEKGNSTRFFVIRKKDDKTTSTNSTAKTSSNRDNWKSLITFTIEHSNPGALANCLTVFSSHGINLTMA
ncbi:unnamed protein product [Alternaria alternata]